MNKRLDAAELRALLPEGAERVAVDLGCGSRKRAGCIGVDKTRMAGVDIVCDIEEGFPFADDTLDAVYANFLFEHLADIVHLFDELHRTCRDGALVEFTVPHPQSYTQYKDPTHRSVITVETLRYFTRENWYGADYGIRSDFKLVSVRYHYLPPFAGRWSFLFKPLLKWMRRYLWNIVHSVTFTVQAVK